MSRPFIHDDFLLDTPAAVELYHRHAAAQPIIDFHNHLPPQEITSNKRWANLTQIWLYGDHYKWRAMRSNGIPEAKCTGPASDWERFEAFAATIPYCLRNPMYHWTALELKRYFGIDDLLPATAEKIWAAGNEKLKSLSARSLCRDSKVVALCTTDDPTDTLEHHRACADDPACDIGVYPAWSRWTRACSSTHPPLLTLGSPGSEAASDMTVGDSWSAYRDALQNRHDFFAQHGCPAQRSRK